MRRADDMLRDYFEALARLSSAPSQRLTVLEGRMPALRCEPEWMSTSAASHCPGTAEQVDAVWRCDTCKRPWRLDPVSMGRTEVGGKVIMKDTLQRNAKGDWVRRARAKLTRGPAPATRSSDTRSHALLRYYGPLLDQLTLENVHAAAAWWLHVLDDEPIVRGLARKVGAPVESEVLEITVARRLAWFVAQGTLPPVGCDVTTYRVQVWITWARERLEDLVRAMERREPLPSSQPSQRVVSTPERPRKAPRKPAPEPEPKKRTGKARSGKWMF